MQYDIWVQAISIAGLDKFHSIYYGSKLFFRKTPANSTFTVTIYKWYKSLSSCFKSSAQKKKKPVTSLDELNELKWTNPNYNWNIFYMYKIGFTADKRRQAYKGKFRSVWRNWWNYNMYVRGSWCSCRGGWHTRAPSAHHASPVLKVPGPEVVVVVCRMQLKSLHKAPHSTLLKNLWTTLKSWIHGRKAANLNTLNSAKSGQKKTVQEIIKSSKLLTFMMSAWKLLTIV